MRRSGFSVTVFFLSPLIKSFAISKGDERVAAATRLPMLLLLLCPPILPFVICSIQKQFSVKKRESGVVRKKVIMGPSKKKNGLATKIGCA